jgi:hypothetical protein
LRRITLSPHAIGQLISINVNASWEGRAGAPIDSI